ncbi:MAG: hypothetical protein ABEJ56_00110 [Candidatus Nanohaloarchaea archaeon]
MGRIQPGITIEEDLWKKAKEKYGQRNCSDRIEELIAEDLDQELDQSKEPLDIVEQANLTPRQQSLAYELLEKDDFPYAKSQVANIARKKGIYQRSNFVKKAVEKLCQTEKAPFGLAQGNIISAEFPCSCGAKINSNVLKNTNEKCPKCERKIILTEE